MNGKSLKAAQRYAAEVGNVYGQLEVVEYLGFCGPPSYRRHLFRVKCVDCGFEEVVEVDALIHRGKSRRRCQKCVENAGTICWSCEWAGDRRRCPWAGGKPRGDWEAELRIVDGTKSYLVKKCPGYYPDRRKRETDKK